MGTYGARQPAYNYIYGNDLRAQIGLYWLELPSDAEVAARLCPVPESPRPTRTQLQGLPEEPLVTAVTKLEHERVALGGRVAHRRQLHGAAANGQPAVRGGAAAFGGDTLFVNRFLVYERSRRGCSALPPGSPPSIGPPSRCWPQRGVKAKVLSSEHPRGAHPPGDRGKALYVNCGHTSHFRRWSQQESQPLLEYLFQQPSAAGVHLPLPLAARLPGGLGQPLHPAPADHTRK